MLAPASTVTGLNIAVPTNFGGILVPVTVNYAPVGQNGINLTGTTNATLQLVLSRVKYLSGSTTAYLPAGGAYGLTVASNTFDLVGSAPTVSLAGTTNTLSVGSTTVGKITVSANAAGNITLLNLPIRTSVSGALISTSTAVTVLDDVTGQTVTVTGATYATSTLGAGGSLTLTLGSDNTIAANSSKTYDIQIPISYVTGTGANSASVALGLGVASSFTFNDINGGGTNVTGAVGGSTFIVNYPSGTVSIHN